MTTGVTTTGAGPILSGDIVVGITVDYIIHGDGTDGTTGAGVALVGITGAGEDMDGTIGAGVAPLPGIMAGDGTIMAGEAITAIPTMDMVEAIPHIMAITIPEGVITAEIL
jgi:hypothetical protein